jgi:hypothetical protein
MQAPSLSDIRDIHPAPIAADRVCILGSDGEVQSEENNAKQNNLSSTSNLSREDLETSVATNKDKVDLDDIQEVAMFSRRSESHVEAQSANNTINYGSMGEASTLGERKEGDHIIVTKLEDICEPR